MTAINIERLASGTILDIRTPHWTGIGEVLEITFDGWDVYTIEFCTDPRLGWDATDSFCVSAGGTVEPANGRIYLRSEADITLIEWEAKRDAENERSAAAMVELDRLHNDTAGYDAPAMEAAE